MNHTKSSILLLNSNERKNPIAKAIQFNVVDQFKYLGIHIVLRLEQVACANYDPLMAEINESIDRWMSIICWFSMEQPQGKTTLVFIVLTI